MSAMAAVTGGLKKMNNPDRATCPYCEGEFLVTPDMYGYRTPCPLCGKKMDIFPDDKYFIDTPWGKIGIGVSEDNFFMKLVLTWLIKKAAAGKERLREMGKV